MRLRITYHVAKRFRQRYDETVDAAQMHAEISCDLIEAYEIPHSLANQMRIVQEHHTALTVYAIYQSRLYILERDTSNYNKLHIVTSYPVSRARAIRLSDVKLKRLFR